MVLSNGSSMCHPGLEQGKDLCTDNCERSVTDIATDTTTPLVVTGTSTLLRGCDSTNLNSTGVAGHKKRRSLGFKRQQAGLLGK